MSVKTGSALTKPTTDETALDPTTFDWNGWLNGATPVTRSVTIYQRPDLLADIEEIQTRIRIEGNIPDQDRGLNDPKPEDLQQQLEQVVNEFRASSLVIRVRGRSDERQDRVSKAYRATLPKTPPPGETDEELEDRKNQQAVDETLHQLADAIVSPPGITVDHLRKLVDISETQVKMLSAASGMADKEAPRVTAPFSPKSSPSPSPRP